MNLKKNKKIIIGLIVGTLVLAGGVSIALNYRSNKDNSSENQPRITMLKKTDLTNSISSSGAIQSGTSTNVYSNFGDNYTLKEVNVEIGDVVKAGDILAIIDTTDFEKQILQDEETLKANQTKNKITLENKKNTYEQLLKSKENGTNTNIVNAVTSLEVSKNNLETAQSEYDYNKMLFENGEISEQVLNQKSIAYENAKNDYAKAENALNNARESEDNNIIMAKNDYESALATYNNNTEKMKLDDKKEQLKKAVVKAPVDGTITSVNVSVGDKCGSGAFFVIQDLSDLVVIVDVDETQIASVNVGQKVKVSVDGAGDDKSFNGEVVSVDPISSGVLEAGTSSTSSKTGTSTSSTSSDVTFNVKVQIIDNNENVKVGMNSVVSIIIDELKDVYAVPYDAIKSENGKDIVYTAKKAESGYIAEPIIVEKGFESDALTEIKSDSLNQGMIIIMNPLNYSSGSELMLDGDKLDVMSNIKNSNMQQKGSMDKTRGEGTERGEKRRMAQE